MPYAAPEPKDNKWDARKTVERNGVVFENGPFRITGPMSTGLVSRLKGALTKDKYRIQYSYLEKEMIAAYAEVFDDILTDWKVLCDVVLPELGSQKENMHKLQALLEDVVNKGGAATRAYRKQSTSSVLLASRERFEQNLRSLDQRVQHHPANENQLQRFELYRTLGTGSFGRVLLVKDKKSGKYCAMKIIKKDVVIRLKQVEHTANEKNILACVEHPLSFHWWTASRIDGICILCWNISTGERCLPTFTATVSSAMTWPVSLLLRLSWPLNTCTTWTSCIET